MKTTSYEISKQLGKAGFEAARLKITKPEFYRKLSNEDKVLFENAIQKSAYIIRQEMESEIMSRVIKIEDK